MQVGPVIRRRVTNRGGTREERGRLKTQDYTRLRDSINDMYKASRAREAQLIDLFLADTLDVDDFLRLKNRNANAPKVAYQVCIDHERTWDKEPVGIKFRDRIEVNGPRVDEPWVQWTAAKFEGKVGVSPTQFLQICEQHGQFLAYMLYLPVTPWMLRLMRLLASMQYNMRSPCLYISHRNCSISSKQSSLDGRVCWKWAT